MNTDNDATVNIDVLRSSNNASSCRYSTHLNTTATAPPTTPNANEIMRTATGIFFSVRAKRAVEIQALEFVHERDPNDKVSVEIYSTDGLLAPSDSANQLVWNSTLNKADSTWDKHFVSVDNLVTSPIDVGITPAIAFDSIQFEADQVKTIYVQLTSENSQTKSFLTILQLAQDNLYNVDTGSIWKSNDDMEIFVGSGTSSLREATTSSGIRRTQTVDNVALEELTSISRSVFQGTFYTTTLQPCPDASTPKVTTQWETQQFGVDGNEDLSSIEQSITLLMDDRLKSDVQLRKFSGSPDTQLKLSSVVANYKATNNRCPESYQPFFRDGCQIVDIDMSFQHVDKDRFSKQLKLELNFALSSNNQEPKFGTIYLPNSDQNTVISKTFSIICTGVPSQTILNPIQRSYLQSTILKFFDNTEELPPIYNVQIESQATNDGRRRHLRNLQISENDRPVAVLKLETAIVSIGPNATQDAFFEAVADGLTQYQQQLLGYLAQNHYYPGPVNSYGTGTTDFGAIFASLFRISTSISRNTGGGGGGVVTIPDDGTNNDTDDGDNQLNDILILAFSVVLGLSVIFLLYRFATDCLLVGRQDKVERMKLSRLLRKKKRERKNKSSSSHGASELDRFIDDDEEDSRQKRRRENRSRSMSNDNLEEPKSLKKGSTSSSSQRPGEDKVESRDGEKKKSKSDKKSSKKKKKSKKKKSSQDDGDSSRPTDQNPSDSKGGFKLKRSSSFGGGRSKSRDRAAVPSWDEFVAGGKSGTALFDRSQSRNSEGDDDDAKTTRSVSRPGSRKPKRSTSCDDFDAPASSSSGGNQAGRNGRGIHPSTSMPIKPQRRTSFSSLTSDPSRSGKNDRTLVRSKSRDADDARSQYSESRNKSGQNGRGVNRSRSAGDSYLPTGSNSSSTGERRRGVGRAKSMDTDFFGKVGRDDRSTSSANRAGDKGRGIGRSKSYDLDNMSVKSGSRFRGRNPARNGALLETPSARVNASGQVDTIKPDPKRGVGRSRSMDGLSRTNSVRNRTGENYDNGDDNRSRAGRDSASVVSTQSKRNRPSAASPRGDGSVSGKSRDGKSVQKQRKTSSSSNQKSSRSPKSSEGRPPMSSPSNHSRGTPSKKGVRNTHYSGGGGGSSVRSSGGSVQSSRSKASRVSKSPSHHVRQDKKTGRMVFEAKGRKIYEFEQSDKDITIFIGAPSFIKSMSELTCKITKTHLQLGLTGGAKWFIDEDTYGPVETSKSSWILGQEFGQNIISVYLRKTNRGELWETALYSKKSKGSVRPA